MSGKLVDKPYDIPNILIGAAFVALIALGISAVPGCNVEPARKQLITAHHNIVRLEGDWEYSIDVYYLDDDNILQRLNCIRTFSDPDRTPRIIADVPEGEPCRMGLSGRKYRGHETNFDTLDDRRIDLHIRKSDLGKYLENDALTCIEEPK